MDEGADLHDSDHRLVEIEKNGSCTADEIRALARTLLKERRMRLGAAAAERLLVAGYVRDLCPYVMQRKMPCERCHACQSYKKIVSEGPMPSGFFLERLIRDLNITGEDVEARCLAIAEGYAHALVRDIKERCYKAAWGAMGGTPNRRVLDAIQSVR
jgi:hypothetical protein